MNKKLLLYHFSDKLFDTIKPSHFGYNYHSKNEKNVSNFPRFFCYDTKKPIEAIFKASAYCYIIKVDKKDVYDLDKDILNLKSKFQFDIDKILEYVRLYFVGCFYSHSFKCYIIFKELKPIKIIQRGEV